MSQLHMLKFLGSIPTTPTIVRLVLTLVTLLLAVLFYSFLYSGKCSPYTAQETFTNNSSIPSSKKILSSMPSERWIPARVFM